MDLSPSEMQGYFPKLAPGEYRDTSLHTPKYNCIAYAAGKNDAWWEPATGPGYYWPAAAPFDYTESSYIKAYEAIGYVRCDNGIAEDGFEKVAVYADQGEGTHAALQLPNGKWTSKLGIHQDIEHPTPESLAGGDYGQVVCFLKRTRSTP